MSSGDGACAGNGDILPEEERSQDPEDLKTEEEYVRAFEKQIGRADHIETGSRAVLDICIEEALAFFDGQYSAEHAAELTRHRVQTYLDETS